MGQLWNSVLDLIFWVLQQFYAVTRDWGFAIILLTLAFRVVLIPLTWKQTKSMFELQEIQPKIKALQDKYKDDKEKQQEELMKFYQENKVNPFSGCLPLILQMPLFIALFSVLRTSLANYIEMLPAISQPAARHFSVFLPDITMSPSQVFSTVATSSVNATTSLVTTTTVLPQGSVAAAVVATLPYLLLVVLFGLSVWLPQYLMSKDPTQRRTGTYMAIVMLWFGWVSPAGVLIYWVTSSAWQVVQQLITQRMLGKRKEAAELAEAEAKAAKKAASKSSSSGAKAQPKPKSKKKK